MVVDGLLMGRLRAVESIELLRQLMEGMKIMLGAEAFNLLNHPNFAVPSNTQSPLTLGGNGDAVFRDPAGHFANNVGRIFSTVDSAREIQLAVRFLF